MSDPIIIADGYSAEPYGDGYIISHRDGGRRTAEHDMASAVREIARLRAALAAQVPQWMPIESRPSSIRYCLIANAKTKRVAAWVDGVIHNLPGSAADWQYGELSTHWQDLPAAPGASPPPAALALVPVEPTEAMQLAGALAHQQSVCHDFIGPISDAWAAMLTASQQAAVCIQCGARHDPGQNTMCAA